MKVAMLDNEFSCKSLLALIGLDSIKMSFLWLQRFTSECEHIGLLEVVALFVVIIGST